MAEVVKLTTLAERDNKECIEAAREILAQAERGEIVALAFAYVLKTRQTGLMLRENPDPLLVLAADMLHASLRDAYIEWQAGEDAFEDDGPGDSSG